MASTNEAPLPEPSERRGAPGTRGNYYATAALVLGILGGGVVAIALGYAALVQIKDSGGTQTGESQAKAGMAIATVELLIFAGLLATGTI